MYIRLVSSLQQPAGVTACQPNPWLGGHNRSARSKFVWQSSLVFGPRCIPRPQCPEGCLVHPSNTALGYLPELQSPAPLRCGVGKGTPKSVVKVLHVHKSRFCQHCLFELSPPVSVINRQLSSGHHYSTLWAFVSSLSLSLSRSLPLALSLS